VEALGFLFIYACYVCVILLDKRLARLYYTFMSYDMDAVEEFDPAKHLLTHPYVSGPSWSSSDDKSASDSEDHSGTPMIKDYEVFRIPQYTSASDSEHSETSLTPAFPSLFRKSSAPTPRSKKVMVCLKSSVRRAITRRPTLFVFLWVRTATSITPPKTSRRRFSGDSTRAFLDLRRFACRR
jgi:hypothetical protein